MKIIFASLIVTIGIAIGFAVASWLKVPSFLYPVFLVPAFYIFSLINEWKWDWIMLLLVALVGGISNFFVALIFIKPSDFLETLLPIIVVVMFQDTLEHLCGRIRFLIRLARDEIRRPRGG